MPLENAQLVSELNPLFPLGSDPVGEGDNHIRQLKSVLQQFYSVGFSASLRRSYAEAGYTLVDGSFEQGGLLATATEVLLYEFEGVAYAWEGSLPKAVLPASSPGSTGGVGDGAWRPVGNITLRAGLLASGDEMIGMTAGGVLKDVITYVTPEQFGAIGDGTIHPLSERYTSLPAAQAVYPHVTALTQTIDWAACQAAENYARGKSKVQTPAFAHYHFGDDGLQLGENSKWFGVDGVQNDKPGPTMTRTFPTVTPTFGQCYIVRVMPAPVGAADEFVRGVVFKGIKLRYPVARRTPVKNTKTICMHFGNAIRGRFDISCWGAEYGVYTWSAWGNMGNIYIDTCHKGYFSVPRLGDGERAGGGATTSNRFRIECDVTPFPITIGQDSYSQYFGYFEGCRATDSNYDSANETACGITIIDSCSACTFDFGVETWQGVFVTKAGSAVSDASFRFGWWQNEHYLMSTGNEGSDAAIRAITGTSASKIQLPAAQRAVLNVLSGAGSCAFIFNDVAWYFREIMSEPASTRYMVNIQNTGSTFTFIGGWVSFNPVGGAAPISFSVTEAMKSQIVIVGCRTMDTWCSPNSGYRWIAKNLWRQVSMASIAGVKVAEGQYADFPPPTTTYKVVGVDGLITDLGVTGAAITHRPSLFAYDGVTKAMRAGTSFAGATVLTFKGYTVIEQG